MRRFVGQYTLWQIMAVIAAVAVVLALARFAPGQVVTAVCGGFAFLGSWEAQRGRPKVGRDSGHLIFQRSVAVRLLAIFLLVGLILTTTNRSAGLPFRILLVLSFIQLLFFWHVTCFWIVVSPEGLRFRLPWRRGFFILWQEIEEVCYSWAKGGLVIRSCHGRKVAVPPTIAGFAMFVAELEKHLDPSGLEKPYAGYLKFKRRLAATERAS